jgi:hypothetical protein
MILLLVASLLAAPSWQRQAGETCQNYAARIEADNHALWREHWCGDGPCFRVVPIPGTTARTATTLPVHQYWAEKQHGCSFSG